MNLERVFDEYGLPMLLRFEGLYLRPYLCPAGVPTIGLGSTRYEDGTRVTLADKPITKERAISLARVTYIRDYLTPVLSLCALQTEAQAAAITDFAYNLGIGALKSSTLRKKINQGDFEVPKELMKWVYAGGKKFAGLEKRRAYEAALFVDN